MSCPGTSGNGWRLKVRRVICSIEAGWLPSKAPPKTDDDRLTVEVAGKDGAPNGTAHTPIEMARRLAFLLTVACKPRTWSRRLRGAGPSAALMWPGTSRRQGRHRRNRYGFVRGRLFMSPPLELLHSAAVGGEL